MVDDARDLIARAARGAGVDERAPSLEALGRRRLEVWGLLIFVLCAVGLLAGLDPTSASGKTTWVSPAALRLAVLALVFGVSAYAVDKERRLRRLERLVVDERVRAASLGRRLDELTAIVAANKAVNSVLDLGQVLDVILRSALDLLGGGYGSVMLLQGDTLRIAAASGERPTPDEGLRLGESIAGRVASTGRPLLVNGPADHERFPGHEPRGDVESAMCVPLVHRGERLGVLNVNATATRQFDDYDLQVLTLFAEAAAIAIANARLFAAEQAHVSELLELDRLKSEFVASVSHELRTPLASVANAVVAFRRTESEENRAQLLDIIERQARRLSLMVEEMLESARLEQPGVLPLLRPVDVAALVRLVALEWQIANRPVSVDAPETCEVRADPEALRQVLSNLIENAFKHGAEPVAVTVEPRGDQVVVSVVDHGPGVPEADRQRVFDRFHRLDASRDRPGVGLGLAIVRGLVTACGGTVWVDETEGGGAAFRVALARRVEPQDRTDHRTQDALELMEETGRCPVGPES